MAARAGREGSQPLSGIRRAPPVRLTWGGLIMAGAPWAKVWWSWYTSRSHIGLSGVALALGPALMLLGREAYDRHNERHCDAGCDGSRDSDGDSARDVIWLVDAQERPITAQLMASVVRFPLPDVQGAMGELVACGTLTVSEDNVYGFPNFVRYQETPQARRMRKLRGSKKRHSDASGDAFSDGVRDDKREEGRGKREEEKEKREGACAPASAVAPAPSALPEVEPQQSAIPGLLVAQASPTPAQAAQAAPGSQEVPQAAAAPATLPPEAASGRPEASAKKRTRAPRDERTALGAAVDRLAEEFGHETPPTASQAHWGHGVAKVRKLVERGAALPDAAERVARCALEHLRDRKSSSFGYALQDCTLRAQGATRDVRRGYVPSLPDSAYTGREVSPDELFGARIDNGTAEEMPWAT